MDITEVLLKLEPEIRRTYARKMRRLCRRIDLDDLIQAINIKAWQYRHTCRGTTPAEVRRWLRVVAANAFKTLVYRHLSCANRSLKREADGDKLEHYIECDPSQAVEVAEIQKRVRAMVASLPSRERQAVAMRHLHELGYADIAPQLGLSVSRSKVVVTNGLKRLRAMAAA